MRSQTILALLFVIVQISSPLKILLMCWDVSNSQLGFYMRIADTLLHAGHEVTIMKFEAYAGRDSDQLKIDPRIKVHNVDTHLPFSKDEMIAQQAKFIFKDFSYFDFEMWKMASNSSKMFAASCEKIAQNKELIQWVKSGEYDLAMPHMYSLCALGIIKLANIPTWIWVNSAFMMDFIAYVIGPPIFPSYVPPMMMAATDNMNLLERTKSFMGHAVMYFTWPMLVGNKETEMYRQVYGHSFPDLYDVARECPLAMLNSNEMFEFPRPLMAKFVYIGGLGMGIGNETRSPLNLDFKKLVDESKSIVVFTFGSIAPAYKMPDDWKEAFWGAFKDLSEHTFIMRYEKPEELVGKLPSNVHAFKWIPQTDLLLQPKTKLLITHGGYNSLQEAISTAVPVVAIPLFGDQPKNGKIIESRHFGVTLQKSEIQRDKIREAIKTVVEDESYKKSITRVRQMIKKRPVSAEDLLIRWTEFVGEFKTLENLKPKAQDLSFIVYHSVDVMAFLLFVAFTVLYIIYLIFKFIIRLFMTFLRKIGLISQKQKTE